jgi:hypothetical protein
MPEIDLSDLLETAVKLSEELGKEEMKRRANGEEDESKKSKVYGGNYVPRRVGKGKGDPNQVYSTTGVVSRKPRVKARHYDAHHLNEGFEVEEPTREPPEKMFVYCQVHRTRHPLNECVYVDFGIDSKYGKGLHFVCRQAAKENGWEEYTAK